MLLKQTGALEVGDISQFVNSGNTTPKLCTSEGVLIIMIS